MERIQSKAPPILKHQHARTLIKQGVDDLRTRFVLKREPLLVALVVLSLTLGLGFHTFALSIYRCLVYRPLTGVTDPERVVLISGRGNLTGGGRLPISLPDYRDFMSSSRTVKALAAYQGIGPTVTISGYSEQVMADAVSSNFFDVLGVKPLLGRTLLSQDDMGSPVVVLSFRFWRDRFAKDPGVIGRKILINGQPHLVVGVCREAFTGIEALRSPRLWIPITSWPGARALQEQRSSRTVLLLGRLADGVTSQQVEAELHSISDLLAKDHPEEHDGRGVALVTLTGRASQPSGSSLVRIALILLLLSALFLVVACGNVAILLLLRSLTGDRATSIRIALGAPRERLLRQRLLESLLLAGGTVFPSLFLAKALQRILLATNPSFARPLEDHLSLGAWEVGAAVAVTTCVVVSFNILPLFHTLFQRHLLRLEGLGNDSGVSTRTRLLGNVLLGSQVLLCTLSLALSALFIASLLRLMATDPGFERSPLLFASLDLKDQKAPEDFVDRIFQDLPLLHAAASSESNPLTGFRVWRDVSLTSGRTKDGSMLIASNAVSENYFQVIGLPILRGRAFGRTDDSPDSQAVIVSESLSRLLWRDRDPLGQRLFLDEEPSSVEVVGIARDVRLLRAGDPIPTLYVPFAKRLSSGIVASLRFSGREADAVRLAQEATERATGKAEIETLAQIRARSLLLPRWNAAASLLLATACAALTTIGAFGISSYFFHRRKREVAIRLALGASALGVFTAMARREVFWISAGALLGVAAALFLRGRLGRILLLSSHDSWLALGAAALMFTVALLAILIPCLAITKHDLNRGLLANHEI